MYTFFLGNLVRGGVHKRQRDKNGKFFSLEIDECEPTKRSKLTRTRKLDF